MLQGFPARILILCSQVSPPDLLPDFPARIELLCSQDSPPEILILCSQDCPPELLPDFPARNVRIYVVVSPCLSFGIVYPLLGFEVLIPLFWVWGVGSPFLCIWGVERPLFDVRVFIAPCLGCGGFQEPMGVCFLPPFED